MAPIRLPHRPTPDRPLRPARPRTQPVLLNEVCETLEKVLDMLDVIPSAAMKANGIFPTDYRLCIVSNMRLAQSLYHQALEAGEQPDSVYVNNLLSRAEACLNSLGEERQ